MLGIVIEGHEGIREVAQASASLTHRGRHQPSLRKGLQIPFGAFSVHLLNVTLSNHYFCATGKGKWSFNNITCILVISS